MAALRAQKRRPMIALFGLGGMGKTALAREAVDRSQQLHLFDDIVWTSAKTERFIGETSIGRQCNRLDITKLPLEKKTAAVQHLLANKRILIVMDNLETVAQSEVVVDNIFQILRKSKVIITSRHRIEHEQTFTMNLSGLSLDDGVSFLKEYSRERGIAVIGQAKPSTLVDIHQITGGAPLAMKLVVGQIANQPMSVVLTALKLVSFKGQDYEFYRFIYQHSWELLDEPSRMVLVEMSVFPPTEGGALTDVQEVSQLAPSDFWSAMNLLVLMSLVDKTGQVDQERFALHSLTHYFILSDITQEWNES